MTTKKNLINQISSLKKLIISGEISTVDISSALDEIEKYNLKTSVDLTELLEFLCFLMAYSPDERLFSWAKKMIGIQSEFVKSIKDKSNFINSGLPYTSIQSTFSFTFLSWCFKEFGSFVKLHSFGANNQKLLEIFQLLLPLSEREQFTEDKFSLVSWLKINFGKNKSSQLENILKLVSNYNGTLEIKEKLFSEMEIFCEWNFSMESGSQFSIPIDFLPISYHPNGIIKSIDLGLEIRKKGIKKIKLSDEELNSVLLRSRVHLASFLKETEPITYTCLDNLQVYDCGRGFSVVLLTTVLQKRQVFDSYLGYMAYKNGLPCAYGGAWLFGEHAKIGLNIFPSFRGGESAWIFSQLMRLYHTIFGVNRFTIEPYQIGKGNSEGLKSGAFWFYYKLGFRPVDIILKDLAEKEFYKIRSKKNYLTPVIILKKLVESDMDFNTEKYSGSLYDPVLFSKLVSFYIENQFDGDRKLALISLREKWSPKLMKLFNQEELNFILNLLLLLDQLPSVRKNNLDRINQIILLIQLKVSKKETDYVKNLRSLRWLQKEISYFLINNELCKLKQC